MVCVWVSKVGVWGVRILGSVCECFFGFKKSSHAGRQAGRQVNRHAPAVVLPQARAGDAAEGQRPTGEVHQLLDWVVWLVGW